MRKYRHILFKLFLILFVAHAPSYAQTNDTPVNPPLEITADGTLEWHRSENKMIAQKNALAVQGDNSIAAQTIIAYYDSTNEQKFDMQKMEAIDNVTISTRDVTIIGDKATYDLVRSVAKMTGENLRLNTQAETLTAQEYFSYNTMTGQFTAAGNAQLTQKDDNGNTTTLEANTLSATLVQNATNSRERKLRTLNADGSVVITTPTEIITGARGVYNAETQKAELNGGVTIKRGPNILQGERADVDLKTNVSRIHGSSSTSSNNTRVRGVFYPGTE